MVYNISDAMYSRNNFLTPLPVTDGIWRAIALALESSSPTAAENAAAAAAALCQVLPAGSHDLVSEIVWKLQEGLVSQ